MSTKTVQIFMMKKTPKNTIQNVQLRLYGGFELSFQKVKNNFSKVLTTFSKKVVLQFMVLYFICNWSFAVASLNQTNTIYCWKLFNKPQQLRTTSNFSVCPEVKIFEGNSALIYYACRRDLVFHSWNSWI